LAVSTALFSSAYLKASRQVAVLGITHAVPQGGVVTAADLTVVHVSLSAGLAPVLADDAARIVGRRAAVGLVPGSLITMADLSDGALVPSGEAVVGVSVKASQLPAVGVVPGDSVDVVLTGIPGQPAFTTTSTGASSGQASDVGSGNALAGSEPSVLAGVVLAPHVLVTGSSPETASNGSTTDVSLLVPSVVAPVLASASAAGQVALVEVAPAR
jgi:hypothetical protein